MRDACISSLDTLDEEQFLGDLFTMPSFFVKDGYNAHDPHGWSITKEFKQKVRLILAFQLSISCILLLTLFSASGVTCSSQNSK